MTAAVFLLGYQLLKDDRIPLTPEAVQGRWVSPAGGELVFGRDGSVVARDLPGMVFRDEVAERQSGAGTWELESAIGDDTRKLTTVTLHLDTLTSFPGGFNMMVSSAYEDRRLLLVMYVGDPDLNRRYILHRVSAT